MNKEEWDRCQDPQQMLRYLMAGNASGGKLRLLAAAGARRIWPLLGDIRSQAAVHASEVFAEGEHVTLEELNLQASPLAVSQDAPGRGTPALVATYAAYASSFQAASRVLECLLSFAVEDAVSKQGGLTPQEVQAVRDVEGRALCDLVREIFGNPFHPLPAIAPGWLTWKNGTVLHLARSAYDERAPSGSLDNGRLVVLADGLEESGCAAPEILRHLRSGSAHWRGCHVLDALLGKC
jgi:hypothetical protein